MKKWLLIASTLLLLAACSDDTKQSSTASEQPTDVFESVIADNEIGVALVETPNDDVQAVIDMTDRATFASFIYSISGDSYLLLNSDDAVDITADDSDTTLNIHITRDKTTEAKQTTQVYAISFTHQYDTIKLFEEDVEIPFDIWTE